MGGGVWGGSGWGREAEEVGGEDEVMGAGEGEGGEDVEEG